MNALQRAWNFLTWQSAPQPPEVREAFGVRPIAGTLNRPQWPKHNVDNYSREAYLKLALVFRCVGVLSQAIASAPLRVYVDRPDGPEPDETNGARRLVRSPNRDSNEARFLAQVAMTMSVAGFCVIEKERAVSGRPMALWPINPAYCKPIPRLDASPDWEIRIPGYDPHILAAEDCIALTFADRVDQNPLGIGAVEIILREVSLLNIQTDFLKAFFDQGAMPVYALVPRAEAGSMSQAQADIIREKWRQRYGGLSASSDPAILAGIEDVKRLSFDFDELAFTDLRDVSDLAICQAFGIPPILVGSRFGLERSTFANYAEARTSFYQDTVVPLWNRIEDAFGRGLLLEFDQRGDRFFNFDTSDVPAMQEDTLPRRTWAVSALQAGGISTHQFAAECGIQPVGADVFLRSFNVIEVPATAPRQQRTADRIIERSAAALSSGAFYRLPEETRNRLATGHKRQIAQLATAFTPKLQAFFDRQAERIIDNVLSEQRSIDHGIDWAEELRLLQEMLGGFHVTVIEAAYNAATDLGLGVNFDLRNPFVQSTISELAERIVGIDRTTRDAVRDAIQEVLDEGPSIERFADRIREIVPETYRNRAETISRTESQVAFNRGSVLSYQESGVVDRVELSDNPDHTEYYKGAEDGLSCADRHGLIVPIDRVNVHIVSEHPNGSLAVLPVAIVPVLQGDA